MPKILNFGSLNIDYVYAVDHFVRPGETTSALERSTFCGGKGLNQSIALARAGAQVWHAGAIGQEDGAFLLTALQADGINTELVAKRACATGHAIIQVEQTGQNCILLFGGANQTITADEIDTALSHFDAGDIVVLQNEINLVPEIIRRAKARGMRVALNPSPIDHALLAYPLELCDFLLLNEVEAADLCGAHEKNEMLAAMCQKYPAATVVLTLGKQGVVCGAPDMSAPLSHGIYNVSVVDTTAAGDTFTGYFLASVAAGLPLDEALRRASVASSIAVSRSGAEPSIPHVHEVEESKLTLAAIK